ncbi:MAG: hypothetical protein JNL41_19380 [Phenylobacterium sp.]|uniref:hypothetical protein n=1 Tax=Phenylobacterium sp. TaxID=1871053 RepID=UPI001A61945F|nr:hypothetical protein [Phenylobacterium sp.]MBL8556445.1 hypothetical protein [Phenylobacterium sp.]
MADGSRNLAREWSFGEARLGWATAARSSLWARCGCGREAVVDPRPWIAQGLGRQLVRDLEHRLRCVCGARQAQLEIRGLAEAPGNGAGGIHVFR